ncbi:MAG: dipeptide ABC transporter ATP-binding protein [Serratia liquefaciens]|jgi:glutathione transport system ATP-binding protein|uniref:dipeptide ABC transporter ATP-binding protein n=1 Tax=Serratia liquefaciens TaxID=614 RepID=UPI0011F0A93E|nr:dipeptide ABC transporter ATP-binding protein [Serratia liquefaciens]MCH4195663.1 dipeptide ABC transporter ATP-binding protein [Serratia liquefaciens]MCH4234136.1 dipeptide ABC transporter ATP-binding protein [Serratia liquefaciens]MCI1216565.1 dipeptide ABC transporter ATP-binding protein [Serratia liquefaciens]MCI1237408.1 dipeptide ABC transporter ATP-binding protein [Serratia liquefaciens]MCI1252946.1 dipeptide ABC transporter ATP-binding protein [Serratia liquefaciens]
MTDALMPLAADAGLLLPPQRVLSVRDLSVQFQQQGDTVEAVRNLSFDLDRGETLAIVGESGSGKSVTSLALMRLVEQGGGNIVSGTMPFRRRNGEVLDLAHARQGTLRTVRGADMAMIFQEPMTSLNPVFPVGEQIAESLRLHQAMDHRAARQAALQMLDLVRIPEAKDVLNRYPHQLSGGMRQRVMIAMALSCKPALLIADEPTTALDVTIQAQILQLIRVLQQEMQMGVIFITHDMGVVAEIADRVLVMRQGEQVEQGPVHELFAAPQQPYTQALLAAVPRLGSMAELDFPAKFPLPNGADNGGPQNTVPPGATPILRVENLVTRFDLRSGILNRVTRRVHAVENVSFELYPGETLGLVGESGCGKSTTGRSLLKLVDSQRGTITFDGRQINQLKGPALQHLRRDIQFIFQDPYASLDPRLTVGFSIMEPLLVHNVARGKAAQERVAWLLERVGLKPEHARRYPHEFSGGQRQRICIARALALNPKVVIADESVSALDVSIQAQIVNLLLDLQREFGIAFLFISHDMAVVERISHRVAVMYLGQIVEIGPRRAVFENPQHAYTRKLMAAVPVADPNHAYKRQPLLVDEIPSPIRALGDEPVTAPLVQVGPGHFVARHPIAGAF